MQIQTLEQTLFNLLIFGKSRFPPKRLYFSLFKQTLQFLEQIYVKNVYGAGI